MRLFYVVFGLLLLFMSACFAERIQCADGTYVNNPKTCSDGTYYCQCSVAQPGMYCTGYQNPELQPYTRMCPCTNFPGYIEQSDGTCVQQKCSEDGTPYGSCSATKPRYCQNNGQLIKKASVCNCSTGYHPNSATDDCDQNTGCAYHSPDCNSRQDCDNATNTCVSKKGCQYQNPACDPVREDCNQNTGKCDLKPGCVNENPPCATGETCDRTNNKCRKPISIGGIDLTGGIPSTWNETGTGTSEGTGACCCLPAAGVGLIGLFVFSRKNEE